MSPAAAFPHIDGQRGLATASQLADAGLSRATVRHAAARDWQQVRPGVYAPHRGPLDGPTRLAAAALWAGRYAVLTGRLALRQHGLRSATAPVALFVVPATARARRDGTVRTVRTGRPVPVAGHVGCVAVTTVERALVDAAAHEGMPARDLRALALAALQQGRTTSERLAAELLGPRPGATPVREALDLYRRGAWSLPEGALSDLVGRDPRLPPMLLNVELRTADGGWLIGVPDGFFPSAGVAVQVHSRSFHSGVDERGTDLWSMTVERDGAYAEHDVVCLGVTPTSIHRRPEETLRRIRTVVLRHEGRRYGPVLVGGVRHPAA